uniref:Uncharacterized protein n=1 Tax=Oryza rufipogon TaxID=4529 RepID=A0A0E0NT96_ORYRU
MPGPLPSTTATPDQDARGGHATGPPHGASPQSWSLTSASCLRPLEDRLHARGTPPRKRIADAQSTAPSSCMSTIDSVLASDALDASAMGDLGKLSTCLNFLPPPRPINDFWRGSCISDQSPLARPFCHQ